MSDIFQEVEDEYRRERLAQIWAKYRIAIIAAVTLLIVGVAGFEGWRYWRAEQLEKSSRGYEAASALVNSDPKKASEELAKLSASGTGGYRLAARFQQAALLAETGNIKGAVAVYDTISESSSDRLFRDYAQLRAAILIADTAKYEDVSKRLEPIASGDNPWKPVAQEILAYVSWRAGKKDEALKLYDTVQKDPSAPDGAKRRALEMTALINAGMKPADVKPPPADNGSLLPPAGESLLPPITPAKPESDQPSSLLGSPEQSPQP